MIYLLAAVVLVAALLALRHQRRRRRLYQRLARRRREATAARAPRIANQVDPAVLRSRFARDRIVCVHSFLEPEDLARLQGEAAIGSAAAERSYLPAHKKGGTLSYEAIHRYAPRCLALYHSPDFAEWLSVMIGVPVQPTADHDQSSCSILYYDQPGDHIGWHFDHNFYRGRHFTVLISLVNRSAVGALSSGRLQRRHSRETAEVPTPGNTLVVFEGASVLHRATAVAAGDQRVMLSMTFCTDPRIGAVKELARRIKDTAYFGPRALLD
jgi:hypothetical protein